MSTGHHVKIVTPDFAADGTKVFIDGVRVARLTNVEFKHHVGSAATLLVEFYPESVSLEGEGELTIMEQESA